jgi:hypothetical protein
LHAALERASCGRLRCGKREIIPSSTGFHAVSMEQELHVCVRMCRRIKRGRVGPNANARGVDFENG